MTTTHPGTRRWRPRPLVALVALALLALGCHRTVPIPPYTSPPVGEITRNWVALSPSGRYFVLEDGTGFYPIGTSMEGSAVQYDSAFPHVDNPSFEADFETLFSNMKLRGENLLRTSPEGLASWDSDERLAGLIKSGALQFLETPVGHYNARYAERIHRLLALAAKHDIYLQLDIGPHSCGVSRHFGLYPYHVDNGGPVDRLAALRTDPTARELWKNRIRYMVDTFGNTDRIFAWELWNEIDIPACGKGNAQESEAWVKEMGGFLRDYERSRYGKAHLVGLSAGVGSIPYEFFFSTGGTDILQSHDYSEVRMNLNPVDTALQAHAAIGRFLAGTAKPFFENERASVELGEAFEPLAAEIEHHQEMAYLASGAAGGGAPWSYPRVEKAYLRPHRVALRKILAGLSLGRSATRPWEAGTSNAEVRPMVIGDGVTTLGWLLHDDPIDFEIEGVRAWQTSPAAAASPLSLIALKKWLRVQRSGSTCPAVDDVGFKRKLADLFGEYLGAEAGAGDSVSYYANPQGYLWFGSISGLDAAKRKRFVDAIVALLGELRLALERAEAQCKSLDALYRGHPPVSTRISLGDLGAGAHEVTWYDDATGEVLKRESLAGSTISFDSPVFRRGVTFVVRDGK